MITFYGINFVRGRHVGRVKGPEDAQGVLEVHVSEIEVGGWEGLVTLDIRAQ